VAKKLSDISKEIDSKAQLFRWRLERMVDVKVMSFLDELSSKCDVYIFSGVIRNYFLNVISSRDIDIVFEGSIDVETLLNGFDWVKNSFGGYKIKINDVSVDMWQLQDTWALSYQKTIDYDLAKFIPNTAFFNFASIVYSYNGNRFYHTPDFAKFLRDREIDITYYPNANIPLCVVNSFYYADKLGLPLGEKLMKYIRHKFKVESEEYSAVQLKHFGRILFTNQDMAARIEKWNFNTKSKYSR
jgi:hypothetical protein